MNEKEKKAIELLKQPPDFSLRYYERENAIDIVLNLIEKQFKVIDEMAEYIRVKTDFTTVGNINAIKEYFYRKVEEDE